MDTLDTTVGIRSLEEVAGKGRIHMANEVGTRELEEGLELQVVVDMDGGERLSAAHV